LENIPLGPLFVKARGLDVIIAADASADDTNNWPNGTSLIYTSRRITAMLNSSHQAFPPIPSTQKDFISEGVRGRPNFFGCDPSNPGDPEWPLVIYLPNSPPLNGDHPMTNTSAFQLRYPLFETKLFLDQAHNNTIGGLTPNANTPDPNWGKCLQCAAVDRARMKLNPTVARSNICTQCFSRYCYESNNPPRSFTHLYQQLISVKGTESFFKKHEALILGLSIGLAGLPLLSCMLGGCCCMLKIWSSKRRTARGAGDGPGTGEAQDGG